MREPEERRDRTRVGREKRDRRTDGEDERERWSLNEGQRGKWKQEKQRKLWRSILYGPYPPLVKQQMGAAEYPLFQ